MKWFYDSGYDYGQGLPERPREVHGFVLDKPTRIRDALVASGVVEAATLESPEAVTERADQDDGSHLPGTSPVGELEGNRIGGDWCGPQAGSWDL